MITLKEWMKIFNYQITEGSEYMWSCFGDNAYTLDSWDGQYDSGYSGQIVFDKKDQTVYAVEIHDYKNNRAYRVINPTYLEVYKVEAQSRNVNYIEATDDYNYTDLEIVDDWIEKAKAIIAGKEYDTRVQVELTLSDDEMFKLMTMAHENDKTLNQMVEYVLQQAIDMKLSTIQED